MTRASTSSNLGLSLSAKARRTREQPISYLINTALHNPGLVNLAAGLVDPLTLPVEPCERIAQRLLCDPRRGRVALQYDTTLGLAELRRLLVKHFEDLEAQPATSLGITADDILVTTGSQQGLYLIADCLLDPGDIVIAEAPSYFVYTGTLESLGAKVMGVPMTETGGMDVDAVEKLLERLQREGRLDRVKMVYTVSYFQNPTGLSLGLESRRRLLEIVKRFSAKHRILILEDAAYRELRYDGEALPSIKSFDPENRYTILAQTFSKPFAPGVKTGYTAMPRDLLEVVLHQKGNHDFGSANFCQHITLESMKDGSYHRHVELLCESYRTKRDAMLEALDAHMPGKSAGVHWTHPHGGLYVWVTLPASVDTSRGMGLFEAAVQEGVLYVPGEYCFQPDDAGDMPRHHLRLSFGQVSIEEIGPGIERLARVVVKALSAMTSAPRPADPVVGGRA
ncbi:MAG: PLP-dependent aminotransferase family protein [Tepidisphaeraceae bacterium]